MADDREERRKKLRLIKGDGGSALNKIVCFSCRQKIRWYPCPRCKKRPT